MAKSRPSRARRFGATPVGHAAGRLAASIPPFAKTSGYLALRWAYPAADESGFQAYAEQVAPYPGTSGVTAYAVCASDALPELTRKMSDDPSTGLDVLLGSKATQALLGAAQSLSEKGYDLDRKE